MLKHNQDDAIFFLNKSDPCLKDIYYEVNEIDGGILSHSTPSLSDLAAKVPTPQQGVLNIPGRAGLESLDQEQQAAIAALAAAQQAPVDTSGFQFAQPITLSMA